MLFTKILKEDFYVPLRVKGLKEKFQLIIFKVNDFCFKLSMYLVVSYNLHIYATNWSHQFLTNEPTSAAQVQNRREEL